MTTLPLRTRRHQQAIKDVARLTVQRDDLIDKLTRVAAKLKAARKAVERLAKPVIPKAAVTPPKPVPVVAVTPPASAPTPPVDSGVPDFLRRSKLDAVSQAVAVEVEEKRKAKSRGRIAKMKAKQSGETRKMPLQGRDALRAIHG